MAKRQNTADVSSGKGKTPSASRKSRSSRTKRAIGLAGFDFQALNRQYVGSDTPVNDASSYGVTIEPAAVASGTTYWQAIGIHHLSPDENRSRHNIFVDVLGEDGQRVRDAHVGWTWEGSNEPAKVNRLDKPDNEPATDIPIFDSVFRLWVQGAEPSDVVGGIHYKHADERNADNEILNSIGHHSFYVVFQRTRQAEKTPVIDGGTPATHRVLWTGVVTAGELNVRTGPGVEHPRIGSLFENSTVQVLAQMGEWLQIAWNGASGFVHGSFVANPTAPAQPVDYFGGGLTPPPQADPTTRAVAATWNRHRALITRESARLGIEPGVAVAVLVAESKGDAFGPDGRMIIRFENHIFHNLWGKQNPERFAQHFVFSGDKTWEGHQWRPDAAAAWQPCHTSQATEWLVFDLARRLDENAAMMSISMGAPQIMGFNHRSIGYDRVQEMFNAFQQSEEAQISSLFRFMEVNGLAGAVQQGNFRRFAQVYNGEGQADFYANIIQRNLIAFRTLTGQVARGADVLPAGPTVSQSPVVDDSTLATAWREQVRFGLNLSRSVLEAVLRRFDAAQLTESIRMAQLGLVLNSYWGQLAFASDAERIKNAGDTAAAQLGALSQASGATPTSPAPVSTASPEPVIVDVGPAGLLQPPPQGEAGRGGRKRALCIGIDEYAQQPLSGCVADARMWAETLVGLGFETPTLLLNGAATRDAILDAVQQLVVRSQPGDVVVIQYAGHGTQLRDISGDEADGDTPNQDEALVPFDFLSGAYVIDDDLGAIFSTIPSGVNLTCFMDCCHSGSISRMILRADERPRFMVADAAMLEAHRLFRQRLGDGRMPGAQSRGKRDIETMREVVFSACQSHEVAWESGGHGEFTLRATALLKRGVDTFTHEDFMEEVVAAFGPSPRQNPLLECASAARTRTLFDALTV